MQHLPMSQSPVASPSPYVWNPRRDIVAIWMNNINQSVTNVLNIPLSYCHALANFDTFCLFFVRTTTRPRIPYIWRIYTSRPFSNGSSRIYIHYLYNSPGWLICTIWYECSSQSIMGINTQSLSVDLKRDESITIKLIYNSDRLRVGLADSIFCLAQSDVHKEARWFPSILINPRVLHPSFCCCCCCCCLTPQSATFQLYDCVL